MIQVNRWRNNLITYHQNGENGFLIHQKDYNDLKSKFGELIKNKNVRCKSRREIGGFFV